MPPHSEPPVPPFHVRQLTIEDGLTLAASPQPGAWQVYDALEPFPPDEGYWAVADSQDALLGFCCLGEPARAPGETSHPAVLDIAIGIRSDLSGQGWAQNSGAPPSPTPGRSRSTAGCAPPSRNGTPSACTSPSSPASSAPAPSRSAAASTSSSNCHNRPRDA
jgi:hypothetical protein